MSLCKVKTENIEFVQRENIEFVQRELAHIPDPEAQTIEKQYC
jgi:hypothetical protein